MRRIRHWPRRLLRWPLMNVLKRLFLAALAGSGLLPLAAQTVGSWEGLRSLAAGAPVTVITAQGKYTGTFVSSSTESLTILVRGSERKFLHPEVVRVNSTGRRRRLRHILIGAWVGVAVSLLTDQTLGVYLRNEANPPGARAAIWIVPIAIGTSVGAVLPAQHVIYRK
jgi:hypothetical protein